ncbi:GNAT family N-acetyltransferase [Martelella alba]|uniref:GNAT family N-acetyltransferase n=1 Tax=Martelella alba TaxID=2590451 RepID=A0A506UAL7_9HYPH|nr:GNAT family protein [Martelella alba]TPW30950.1 GNAT family N-acetyltransferase [Martelella alba]
MTETLRLEPFSRAHFPVLCSWFEEARALAQWGGTRLSFPLDDRQLDAMLALCDGEAPSWALFSAMLGEIVVGHGQIFFDRNDGVARLCRIALAPEQRGKGLSRSMLVALLNMAFGDQAIMRVELNVYDFNSAAIHAYQATGFQLEGIRRSSARFGDERWNTGVMAILRQDWEIGNL